MTQQTTPSAEDEQLTFEAALTQLETLVSDLENGELGLDASVERFRQATQLAGYCRDLIQNARLRITELQPERASNGAGDAIPF